MKWDDLQQLIRMLALLATGWLVNAGQLDAANAETLTGAVVGIVTVAWWWFWNRKAKA